MAKRGMESVNITDVEFGYANLPVNPTGKVQALFRNAFQPQ